jgi:CheY-like chemotaxis protein
VPQSKPNHPVDPASRALTRTILFGEDDIDDQELLKDSFSSVDGSFSLVFAINGDEVLTRLTNMENKDLPCLIVLDYNMPGPNGAEILRELKNNPRYKDIPKIIWSTSGSDTYKAVCLALGANDYFVKPSNVKDLAKICRQLISYCAL